MSFCAYYTAHVRERDAWFLVAIMRSFEHLLFDRTVDKYHSTFEFFVPEGYEQQFLEIMQYFEREEIVSDLKKLPNRLAEAGAVF